MLVAIAFVLLFLAAVPVYKDKLTFNRGSFIGSSITLAPYVQVLAILAGESLLAMWALAAAQETGVIALISVNGVALFFAALRQTLVK